jgi:hypothetical protein
MSKEYKDGDEIKVEHETFLKGYNVCYYYNDQIKETYTYLDNIKESHNKECESDANESDANESDDTSLNENIINEEQREQKEGRECNININVKELLKGMTIDSTPNDATKETNKNVVVVDITNVNKKPILNNLNRSKARTVPVPNATGANKCGREKPNLNMNKIKTIIEKTKNENTGCEKGTSIQDKIQRIIKKINNKIKTEVVKELMEYESILENETKKKKGADADINDEIESNMHAFYHFVLNKINSKI